VYMYVTMSCQLFDRWMCIFTEQYFFSILVRSLKSLSVFYFIIMHTTFIHCTVWKFLLCCNFVILLFFYWPSVLFQFTLFLNDIKSNSDSATSKHSDKNAKIRDGSKNTIEDDPKCSSSNDQEEKNTSEYNPNSKLTSTGSRSDYSSCDAKKSQDSKIATSHDSDDSSADSNSQGKNANSSSEHASANGNATIEEQDHDSYSKDSSASENEKKTTRK